MPAFENWIPLEKLSIADLPDQGKVPAVYAMRTRSTGEIAYIGSTGSLRRRVFGNYFGGVGGNTTQRLHHHLFAEYQVFHTDVAWIVTETYRETERYLLGEFKREHGRLPSWNRR